jgi:hypothetical protein
MLWQISECAFCWMKNLDWRLGRGLLGHWQLLHFKRSQKLLDSCRVPGNRGN